MSQGDLTKNQIEFLKQSLESDKKLINIRLRQGEYQFDLSQGVASFELQLQFPNVKDLVRKMYGEEKTRDIQFIRKIQTILKKMEKSGIIRILPKNQPWELQTYALLSFKFQDIDKNLIVLAAEDQIMQTRNLLYSKLNYSIPNPKYISTTQPNYAKTKIWILVSIVILSYATIMWTLAQPALNPIIFILALCVATLCSFFIGKLFTQK